MSVRMFAGFASGLAAAMSMMAAFVGPAAAQTPQELRGQWDRGGGGVELYDQPGFRGERRTFGGPEGNLGYSVFNDQAMSLRIRDGRAWQFCDDSNFRGRCVTVRDDEPDLNRLGLARRISSFRPVDEGWNNDGGWNGGGGWSGGQEIVLFEGDGYGGRSVRFRDAIPDLGRQALNDGSRSLRARGRWVVCEDANYRGRCATVDGDVISLDRIGMANRISSLRPAGRGDDDWNDGGWDPGRDGVDTSDAAQGRTAAFFPRPRLGGQPVFLRGDARSTADEFCRRAGYRSSAYVSVEQVGRRSDAIADVLCVR